MRQSVYRKVPLFFAVALSLATCLWAGAPAAQAGTWVKTITTPLPDGVLDAATGGFVGSGWVFGLTNSPDGSPVPWEVHVSGTETITYDWVPDDGMTMATDPPPATITLHETAEAQASIFPWGFFYVVPEGETCSTSIGDFGASATSRTGCQSIGGKYEIKDASSGEVSVTSPTLTATVSGDDPYSWYMYAEVEFDTNIVVHAHPCNYRIDGSFLAPYIPWPDKGSGELWIPYMWDSDSGNLADLSAVRIYEDCIVSGTGTVSDDEFTPYDPPFDNTGSDEGRGWIYKTHFQKDGNAAVNGCTLDWHSKGGTLQCPILGDGMQTYAIQVNQKWMFHCNICGVDEIIPSPTGVSGPQLIERVFALSPDSPGTCNPYERIWRYSTHKHGFTAWQDWKRNLIGGSYPIGDSLNGPYPNPGPPDTDPGP